MCIHRLEVFLGNLKVIWPAIPTSLVNIDTIRILLPNFYQFFYHGMQWVQLVILFFLTIAFFRIIRRGGHRAMSLYEDFLFICFLTSLFVIGVLCTLSLLVGNETMPDGSLWTYVQEPRYYGIITILTQLLVFSQISIVSKKMKKYSRSITIVFFILISLEILRGAVFITNRIIKFRANTVGNISYPFSDIPTK